MREIDKLEFVLVKDDGSFKRNILNRLKKG